MKQAKIIAMYLPQYHAIPENDRFWGKGFTDWVTVKNATSLFKGHIQPRVPLNENYYDLSLEENIVWQSELAKRYGIYGFGVYHYWFNNNTNILTRPAEIIRDSDSVDINYFLAWDNSSWKRSWSNVEGYDWSPLQDKSVHRDNEPAVLIPYILGEESDWRIHYDCLSSHFKSKKYIKIDNKPLFIIFNYSLEIDEMCKYWDRLAKNDGFDGMFFIMKYKKGITDPTVIRTFKYEPVYSGWNKLPFIPRLRNKVRRTIGLEPRAYKYNYRDIWESIISNAKLDINPNIYHGGFVSYDDTPRRGNKGTVVLEADPKVFGEYLGQLLEISNVQGKDFVFITAWNEWGEGAMMEPDIDNKYAYLEAIPKY